MQVFTIRRFLSLSKAYFCISMRLHRLHRQVEVLEKTPDTTPVRSKGQACLTRSREGSRARNMRILQNRKICEFAEQNLL